MAKLFAKHIKLDEAKQFLQRARVNIGVGTPQRIIDLIEAGKVLGLFGPRVSLPSGYRHGMHSLSYQNAGANPLKQGLLKPTS